YTQRRLLWNNLRLHKLYVRDRPWCILGDFNAAHFLHDYSVGNSNIDISMREFKECVEDLEILDVQYSGLQFTWTQKPKGNEGLLKKIYRVMANLKFNDVFAGWSKYVSGFHMFRVTKKLKLLKKPLRKLLYKKGNLHTNVNQLRNDLDQVQVRLDADLFNESIREEEATILVAFNDACLMEENRIDVVSFENGEIFENEHVADAFVNHYKMFLGQPGITSDFCDIDLFRVCLDENVALDMTRQVTLQEVKSALFSMGNDKSPGPDGYTAAFFKESWDIMADDFVAAVREFFPNDTDWVKVIKGALNEFQEASGLILPFKEGYLLVKYLGVPLITSRLIIRRFLWKGRSKVGWEAICLPKDEGGLGVRRLDTFNKALRLSWGWRKVLQIRPLIREYIWYSIGDGDKASLWFDNWSTLGPLADFVSSSSNPNNDRLEWRDECGMVKPFLVSMVWATIRHRNPKVDCVIAKLVLAASAYFIWQERNWRMFKNNKRTVQQVQECIYSIVRLKLLSCRFKKTRSGASLAQRWNLPDSCFINNVNA
nr:hypothetical protein [Tanacetum cinerariifolium]